MSRPTCYVRTKFHYASWFEAGCRPASNLSATSFDPASVMKFGFYGQTAYQFYGLFIAIAIWKIPIIRQNFLNLVAWRVHCWIVTSWPCDDLVMWQVDWQPSDVTSPYMYVYVRLALQPVTATSTKYEGVPHSLKPRPHQQHVEAAFDMLLRHVAGVDGAFGRRRSHRCRTFWRISLLR